MTTLTDRARAFRAAIAAFIDGRREEKLKGKEDDTAAQAKYEFNTWLADAASRAHNLRFVTHPIKFTHSAIKGASSILWSSNAAPDQTVIGTHTIADQLVGDFAITDAKHLDIYSLMKVELDGRTFLSRLSEDDQDLLQALHHDQDVAKRISAAFKQITQPNQDFKSHILAKQIYWLVGDNPIDDSQYLLLQPMFSSALEHAVNLDISNHREETFVARGTKKQQATYQNHSTYPSLVARTIGGSNAQNVSPMNKVRRGINYLLPSLPPVWSTDRLQPFFNTRSALDRLAGAREVRDTLKELITFLRSNPPSTVETRDKRKAYEQELGAQLLIFALNSQFNLAPGWSRDERCELPLHQQIWLDPERVHLPLREDPEQRAEDEDFIAAAERGDWPDQVASDFANWVNARLTRAGIEYLGDAEYRHWARQAIVEAAWPVPQQRRAVQGGRV